MCSHPLPSSTCTPTEVNLDGSSESRTSSGPSTCRHIQGENDLKKTWICRNTDMHVFFLCLTWMPMERHLPFLSASFLYSFWWSSTARPLLRIAEVGVFTVMVLLLTCWLAGPWTYTLTITSDMKSHWCEVEWNLNLLNEKTNHDLA